MPGIVELVLVELHSGNYPILRSRRCLLSGVRLCASEQVRVLLVVPNICILVRLVRWVRSRIVRGKLRWH